MGDVINLAEMTLGNPCHDAIFGLLRKHVDGVGADVAWSNGIHGDVPRGDLFRQSFRESDDRRF